MKNILFAFWFFCIFSCPGFGTNSSHLSNDDIKVLETVLRDVALQGMIDNWAVSPEGHYAVLADESIEPAFPQSAQQAIEESEALQRQSKGEDVDFSGFLIGNPDPTKDFILPQARTIPKDIVADILARSQSKVSFPVFVPASALKLVVEKSQTVKETFRPTSKVSTFHKLHPNAVGVIEISLPGYNKDRNVAGVYFYRLRVGLGGGGFFVLLHRTNQVWQLDWSHTVWIE